MLAAVIAHHPALRVRLHLGTGLVLLGPPGHARNAHAPAYARAERSSQACTPPPLLRRATFPQVQDATHCSVVRVPMLQESERILAQLQGVAESLLGHHSGLVPAHEDAI